MSAQEDPAIAALHDNGTESAEGPEVLGSHVCDTCVADNLLKNIGIAQCVRCRNPFCIHFASKYDSLHLCVSCGSDVELHKANITKEYRHEHYDPATDTTVTTVYSRRAKEYKLSGDSWMFVQRRVRDLSDPELDIAIEVHRQYLQLLCAEQERRKMEKMHRNAGIKFILPTGTAVTSTTTVTTQKKSTIVKSEKNKEKAAAVLQQLLGTMSMEDLLKSLTGKK